MHFSVRAATSSATSDTSATCWSHGCRRQPGVDRLPCSASRSVIVCFTSGTTPRRSSPRTVRAGAVRGAGAPEPDATAVVFRGCAAELCELNRRANQLRITSGNWGEARCPVAICVSAAPDDRALLRAQGRSAYVPLDPAYPAERCASCWKIRAGRLLTQEHLRRLFTEPACSARARLDHPYGRAPETNLIRTASDSLPATWLRHLHLSSTGLPKGVMVQHRVSGNLVSVQIRDFAVEIEASIAVCLLQLRCLCF